MLLMLLRWSTCPAKLAMLSRRSLRGARDATFASIADRIAWVSPNDNCSVPRIPSRFCTLPIWALTRSSAGPYRAARRRSMSSVAVKPHTDPAVSR